MAKKKPKKRGRGGVKPKLQPSDKIIPEHEVDQMLNALKERLNTIQGKQDYLLITGMLNTGMRTSEMAHTTVSQAILDAAIPKLIVLGKKRKKGQIIKKDDEGNPIVREEDDPYEVLLSKTYTKFLKDHIKKNKLKPHHKLFQLPETRNIVFNRQYVWRAAKRVQRLVGLNVLYNAHALRHYFCTQSVDRHGVEFTQKQMGHKNTATTMKYTHMLGLKKEIEKRLEEQANL